MGKIYNYDTTSMIGGVDPEIAKHHGVKKGAKSSEHRPHEQRKEPVKAKKGSKSGC